jgi:hypothetical protein
MEGAVLIAINLKVQRSTANDLPIGFNLRAGRAGFNADIICNRAIRTALNPGRNGFAPSNKNGRRNQAER